MTDDKGNPIPEDDPRLPSPESTQALHDQAEAAKAFLEAQGATLGPLVELEARVMALEGLLVNPDPTSAARRLFEYRLQKSRVEVLGGLAKKVKDARDAAEEAARPKIEVASTTDVLRVNQG